MCNGITDCNQPGHLSDYFKLNGLHDFSDEDADRCNNCTGPGLSLCADQRTCVRDDVWCDGEVNCYDVSDERAENCENCQKGMLFRCVFEGLDRYEGHNS